MERDGLNRRRNWKEGKKVKTRKKIGKRVEVIEIRDERIMDSWKRN
jgi:hypothetical protein